MAKSITIPSDVELKALPRYARIALAARCARRVQPLFRESWPDAPPDRLAALERAIVVAEISASRASAHPGAAQAFSDAAANGQHPAFKDATLDRILQGFDPYMNAGVAAGNCAANAAYAASGLWDNIAYAAAVHCAVDAAKGTTRPRLAASALREAVRHDYETLCRAARQGNWNDATPVPAEVFGPLWPSGAPKGWPNDSQ